MKRQPSYSEKTQPTLSPLRAATQSLVQPCWFPMKKILSIAGSDSGGGAGIQADLKTITLLGGYGMTVPTALTAQNTVGIEDICPISAGFVAKQIDAVLTDLNADAVKTGMLYGPEIVETVAEKVREYDVRLLVVDPVMVSKSKQSLLSPEAQEVLMNKLLPQAFLVTPNIPEAEVMTGFSIESPSHMEKAARHIYNLGSSNVLIKGGHLKESTLVDILFDGTNFHHFETKRQDTSNTHGTGCTYSAAVATFLAQGFDLFRAVSKAKQFIDLAIRFALDIGKGNGPTNPYYAVSLDWQRYRVIEELKQGLHRLKTAGPVSMLFPEVQSNLAYSLPCPLSHNDVAAFPGRFVRIGKSFTTIKDPEFGSSRHMADVILTANRFNEKIRSAMNIRYSEEIIEKCIHIGLIVAQFDRKNEPGEVKKMEGSTLSWGVAQAIQQSPTFPVIIFDRGEVGKEPMIRVLGENPERVVQKVIEILKACS